MIEGEGGGGRAQAYHEYFHTAKQRGALRRKNAWWKKKKNMEMICKGSLRQPLATCIFQTTSKPNEVRAKSDKAFIWGL